MLLPALLVLSLVAGQSDPADDGWEEDDDWDKPQRRAEVFVAAWAGNAYDVNGQASPFGVLGGEAGIGFRNGLDLGVAYYAYDIPEATRDKTPVVLARFAQRFIAGSGVEGSLVVGIGAAQFDSWQSWFQVGVGARVSLGPVFLGGEVTFEQQNLLRLSAGLGARF